MTAGEESTGREGIRPERAAEEGREDRAGESAAPAAGQKRIRAHQEHRQRDRAAEAVERREKPR